MTPPPGDGVGLARLLVRIDSRNPGLVPGGPGEAGIARALAVVLEQWGFRVALQEVAPGRFNVIARVGEARGNAPSLMFNGHIDVVDVAGMLHAPFDGFTRDGRLYGRGATDMKGGVAAMCAAAWRAAEAGLAGEVVVAAVADEEFESIGTRGLIASGARADACIVTEPTRLAIAPAPRGFTWTAVRVHRRAAHGRRYDVGIDAIRRRAAAGRAGPARGHGTHQRTHPLLEPCLPACRDHPGRRRRSTYPDACTLRVERRTLPGETPEQALGEMRAACDRIGSHARIPCRRRPCIFTMAERCGRGCPGGGRAAVGDGVRAGTRGDRWPVGVDRRGAPQRRRHSRGLLRTR